MASVPLSAAAAGLIARNVVCVETLLAGGDDYEVLCTVPAGARRRADCGGAGGRPCRHGDRHDRRRAMSGRASWTGRARSWRLKRLSYSHF